MVRALRGGRGEPLLLLLHGLGATADVWSSWCDVLDRHWPGRWVAPDLPGHGGRDPLPRYTFDALAAEVAADVADDAGAATVVLGHSLGGVVGLALAGGGHRVRVRAVVGLGIKVRWSEEELARAQALAQRPSPRYPTRAEAADRYLRVSGLAGLVAPEDPRVDAGLREQEGQWGLALDPAAFAVGAPDLPALLAGSTAPVLLARGEHDPMNTDADLVVLGTPTATLAGLGHNAHVEDPERCAGLLDPYR